MNFTVNQNLLGSSFNGPTDFVVQSLAFQKTSTQSSVAQILGLSLVSIPLSDYQTGKYLLVAQTAFLAQLDHDSHGCCYAVLSVLRTKALLNGWHHDEQTHTSMFECSAGLRRGKRFEGIGMIKPAH